MIIYKVALCECSKWDFEPKNVKSINSNQSILICAKFKMSPILLTLKLFGTLLPNFKYIHLIT